MAKVDCGWCLKEWHAPDGLDFCPNCSKEEFLTQALELILDASQQSSGTTYSEAVAFRRARHVAVRALDLIGFRDEEDEPPLIPAAEGERS
jgi:hypothetical protein